MWLNPVHNFLLRTCFWGWFVVFLTPLLIPLCAFATLKPISTCLWTFSELPRYPEGHTILNFVNSPLHQLPELNGDYHRIYELIRALSLRLDEDTRKQSFDYSVGQKSSLLSDVEKKSQLKDHLSSYISARQLLSEAEVALMLQEQSALAQKFFKAKIQSNPSPTLRLTPSRVLTQIHERMKVMSFDSGARLEVQTAHFLIRQGFVLSGFSTKIFDPLTPEPLVKMEIDISLENALIEVTEQNGRKLKQILDFYFSPEANPRQQPVILFAPHYEDSQTIEVLSQTNARKLPFAVARSRSELLFYLNLLKRR